MAKPPPLFLSEDITDYEGRQQAPVSYPVQEPEAHSFSDDLPPIPYFENIGPVKDEIVWNGKKVPVEFTLLDIWEERELSKDVEAIVGPEKIIAERQLRIARSLYSVNHKVVAFSPDPIEDQVAREEWAVRMKGPLLFALSQAYERAANQPINELSLLLNDPKSEP